MRRKMRAEESGATPDLSTPINTRKPGGMVSISGRVTLSASLYYVTHELGPYGAAGKVLEEHAKRELGRMSTEQRAEMAVRAMPLMAKREKHQATRPRKKAQPAKRSKPSRRVRARA